MTENKPPSLDELEKKLQQAEQTLMPQAKAPLPVMGAMRVSIELVAGIIVGCLAGYWLDQWLGTLPLFFLLGFTLGTVVGIYNVYRLAKGLSEEKTDG